MEKLSEGRNILAIGIDVSKATLDIALLLTEGEVIHRVIPNKKEAIQDLISKLSPYPGKIILESTGRYHLLATLLFSQAGMDLRVLNPLMSHKHLQGGIRKNKTDKLDAIKLAQMAFMEEELPPSFSSGKNIVALRQKIGLMASLEKQMQVLRAIKNGYHESQVNLELQESEAETQVDQAVKALDKARKELEKEIERLVLEEEANAETKGHLTSIPGVSSYGASLMLQFFDLHSPELCRSPKQWIAFAGLDVTVKQSGNWKGKGKLSKRGNAYLRKRLFAMSWGAVMNHKGFKGLYDKMKQEGVSHIEALIRIARKIIRIAFGLIRKKEDFNEQKYVFI